MHTQFGVNANPIHLKNVTIKGQAALDSFGGNATDGSIFDNLVVEDYTRVGLPRGTYNNCVFIAAKDAVYKGAGPAVNNKGTYEFNNCKFESEVAGFEINSVHGVPDSVTLRNSSVTVKGDNTFGVSIQSGNKVIIENNNIKTNKFPYKTLAAVIVNGYWEQKKESDVFNLSILGNTITTADGSTGISTKYAGLNAQSYIVKNNILNHSILELKNNDINESNLVQK
jgi:hypothetical protein